MTIHHVVWDFDGTLFDTYPIMARAFRRALSQFPVDSLPGEEEISQKMQIAMSDAVQAFAVDNGISEGDFNAVFIPLRHALEAEGCQPFEGVVRICEMVCAAGGANYLYTHRSRSALELIEARGMSHLFSGAITMEDGFPRKPAPDALLYLMEKYGIEKSDAIMIGDREIDILAGCNAGMHSCLFDARVQVRTAAEYTIASFGELERVLGTPH